MRDVRRRTARWMNVSIVPSEVAERDAAVDGEPLDLVEHRRVARVERVALRYVRPGIDHVDRRRLRLHHADLHRRRVRAQQHLLGLAELHVERVLHRARRMAGREVERLEVVPVVLDLGPFGDPVAEADEDVLELALALGDQVRCPRRRPWAPRVRSSGGSVDAAGAMAASAVVERGLDRLGELGHGPAEGRPLARVQVLDGLAGPGGDAPLAHVALPELGQLVGRRRGDDGGAAPVRDRAPRGP